MSKHLEYFPAKWVAKQDTLMFIHANEPALCTDVRSEALSFSTEAECKNYIKKTPLHGRWVCLERGYIRSFINEMRAAAQSSDSDE